MKNCLGWRCSCLLVHDHIRFFSLFFFFFFLETIIVPVHLFHKKNKKIKIKIKKLKNNNLPYQPARCI